MNDNSRFSSTGAPPPPTYEQAARRYPHVPTNKELYERAFNRGVWPGVLAAQWAWHDNVIAKNGKLEEKAA